MELGLGSMVLGIALHGVGVILPLCLIGLAGHYGRRCFLQYRMAFNSRQWVKTDGAISNPSDSGRQVSQGGITYSYIVAGVTYFNSQISCDESMFSTSRFDRINVALKSYAYENRLLVYYDPSCPQTAVLKTGVDPGAVVANMMVISLLLMTSLLILLQSCPFLGF